MNFLASALKSSQPLLINPIVAQSYVSKHAEIASKIDPKSADLGKIMAMIFGEPATYEAKEGLAYIPLQGVIGKGLSPMDKLMGAVDVNDVTEWIAMAASDPEVKAVVMDIDSPGGTVTGVPELAEAYRELGKIKPTVSYCEGRACSAAYWVGSQGNRFVASKSAEIGNVGCFVAFPDVTEALAKQGVTMRIYKSGKYKAIGVPGVPVTKEQDELLQHDIEQTHEDFKKDVKAVRSYAQDEDMEGQVFSGKQAADKFMVTGVGSFTHAINCLKL